MVKIPRSFRIGTDSPFYTIPVGIFFVLAGIYGIYLNGIGLDVILIALAGVGFITWGIYVLIHYDDD